MGFYWKRDVYNKFASLFYFHKPPQGRRLCHPQRIYAFKKGVYKFIQDSEKNVDFGIFFLYFAHFSLTFIYNFFILILIEIMRKTANIAKNIYNIFMPYNRFRYIKTRLPVRQKIVVQLFLYKTKEVLLCHAKNTTKQF